MIKVEIIGNLGADAEVKDVQGNKFVTMRVAHSSKWKGQDGQEHSETLWVDVILNNTESAVIPYLKAGVKVFVRGNARVSAYPSKALRQWIGALSVSATEIELCGGQNDVVPRQLFIEDTGECFEVSKHYWVQLNGHKLKKGETLALVDKRMARYVANSDGFVMPVASEGEMNQNKVDTNHSENPAQ